MRWSLAALGWAAIGWGLAGCSMGQVLDQFPEKTFSSSDGRLQLKAPGTWAEDPKLNKMAHLSISRRVSELYVVVLAEDLEHMPTISADEYLEIVLPSLTETLTEVHEHEKRPFESNGFKGIQMDVEGKMGIHGLFYTTKVIKTKHEFLRIMGWTLASKKAENIPKLEKVISTFQVTRPPPKRDTSIPDLTQTFRSPLGIKVKAPKDWFSQPNIHKEATIQITNKRGSAFLIVIAEALGESDDMPLTRFRELTISNIESSLAGAELTEPESTTLGGHPGLVTQISGRMQGMDLTYIQGAVVTEEYGFQILAWTGSKRDTVLTVMRNMIDSVSFSPSIK